MSFDHPDNFPVGYDRGHKATCEWPDCPGGTDCEGLSLLQRDVEVRTEWVRNHSQQETHD